MKIKLLFSLIILTFTLNSQAQTVIILPSDIFVDPTNLSASFSPEVQKYFAFTTDFHDSSCSHAQAYMISALIYRNAVDNKVVATYRPANNDDTCYVDLTSYSNQLVPDMNAGGWAPPQPGANTWCSRDGLNNTNLCPVLDNSSA